MFFGIRQRYIFGNLFKGFLFFLFSFFFLYSLVDFSSHANDFLSKGSVRFDKLYLYYSHQILKRLELLLPLALMISVIRVLTGLNTRRELVALQASGVPLKTLFRPFFFLGLICCITSYCNQEIWMPKSVARVAGLNESEEAATIPTRNKKPFSMYSPEDSSKLIYQYFDPEKNVFFDVYWIPSFGDIWKMKYLSGDPEHPVGRYVDRIVRNKEGVFEKVDSFEEGLIPGLHWKPKDLRKKLSSVKYQKISRIVKLLRSPSGNSFLLQGELQTHLLHKLAMPLLPFLILIGITPFCVVHSRAPALFKIYGCAVLCFVLFFTVIDAMTVLGENRVISPYVAVLTPFAVCFGIARKKFLSIL